GYGEYYDDELDVVQSARSLLLGQTSVIFEHRKGPTEIWLTAVAAGTSTQFDEFTTRLPFVLASLGAVSMTALLGMEFFGQRRGVLAGLLLAAEGIVLAFSRMVQYQGVVLLMIAMVAWCALRFWRAQTSAHEWWYLMLGALSWAFAMLTHWDGALAGVMLLFVVLAKWKVESGTWSVTNVRSAIRDTRYVKALVIAISAVLVPAVFYIQLFLNPQVSNLKTYAGERIGFGVFNGLPAFMLHASFYDASPFIIALLLLVGVFLASHLRGWRAALLVLMLVPFVWSDFLQLGALNVSLLIFIAALALLLRARTLSVEHKTVLVWLVAYVVVYAFVIKSAGLHFYTLMPALVLLAAHVAIPESIRNTQYAVRTLNRLRALGCALLLVVALAFDAVAYLNVVPEYALNFPQRALPTFPTLYRERPRDFFFGFPYRYGWSVIGELYRRGTLRGKFESNETYLVSDWYARDLD
ncbi:MAG: glycosyltransferase family 39 protein, partial [Chloroflexi bacterium]|nr:glycosyltransferase family 39 protein [Chloroflexota bacterium]